MAAKAGNAEFHFAGSAVATGIATPLKLAFQAIDLRQAWPGGIQVEHFARSNRASFNPSISLVHFLCTEKMNFP